MTVDEIADLFAFNVDFRLDLDLGGWTFNIVEKDGHTYLQVEFESDSELQKGRKWLLSPHMTKSELVQTAFKAVLTALEHEAREHFQYRGKAIFGPHYDVDALHEIVERTDARKDVPPR